MIAARYMHDRTEYHRWAASNPYLEQWGEETTADDFGGEYGSPATTVFTVARYAAQAYADEIVADHERCEAIGSRFVSAG